MKIFLRLKETADLVPYGIRWLCMYVYMTCTVYIPEGMYAVYTPTYVCMVRIIKIVPIFFYTFLTM